MFYGFTHYRIELKAELKDHTGRRKSKFYSQSVTHIKIHFLSIRDLRRNEVWHDKWPEGKTGGLNDDMSIRYNHQI